MAKSKQEVLGKVARKQESPGVRGKFAQARIEMGRHMVERGEEIDLVMTALICHEHPMLIGPHGAGKSMLLDAVGDWIQVPGDERFEYILSKYSDPMELFGPINLTALKGGKCERVVEGFLPTAKFAFLDEIWKSSPAILNTLLKVINERTFKYGLQKIQCPLRMLMAASNEFPQDQDGGKELAAMFDRFLFRKKVGYVSEAGRRELLKRSVGNEWGPCRFSQHVTMSEVDSAHDEAKLMPWSADAKRSMWAILEELEKEKVHPGDRRITKSVMAARSYAYLCGADEVEPEHLDILAHVLWDDPVEQPEKCERVVSKLANPLKTAINSLRVQAADVMTSNPPGEVKIKKLEAIRDQLVILKDNPLKAYAKDQVEEMVKQSYYELAGVKN